jgi:glycosyltransferase involved in cell wall biosynthesis
MRIWVLNHYASPPDRPAGTRHYDFGRVLAGRGHEVTIFASSFSHHSRREERLERRQWTRAEYMDGVRFVWIRTTPYTRNDHRRLLNILSYTVGVIVAQQRFPRPDVVVGSSVHLGAVVAAWVIGAVRHTWFAFEVRDLWPQALIDMGELAEHSAAARALRGLERFLYRRAAVIISLLPGAADYIRGAGVPGTKIVYVPNGIADLPLADSRRADLPPGSEVAALLSRIDRWRQAGYLVAGYTGSHGLTNGLHVLVEAARVLRNRGESGIAMAFVGEGPAKQDCERLAREHDLANVLFWPPVPKQAMPAVLGALDVALFPLRDDSVARYGLSSNKLFDYLASGRPVLACCGVTDNPVQASGGGICVPAESPEAVADALMAFAALGEDDRRAMGERGRQWVYAHHGMTGLAGQFLQALIRAQW